MLSPFEAWKPFCVYLIIPELKLEKNKLGYKKKEGERRGFEKGEVRKRKRERGRGRRPIGPLVVSEEFWVKRLTLYL